MLDFKKIKHYSFDLWLTLIKSNPQFKIERTKYFYQHYNAVNKSIEEVAQIFRQVDVMCNAINECTGQNLTTNEMHLMVIYLINNSQAIFANVNVDGLYNQMEKLFYQYPPTLYDANTATTLAAIAQLPNVTMSILSNTAFVKGTTLRLALHNLGIEKYFSFQIYSDEAEFSKPNQWVFEILGTELAYVRQGEFLQNHEIVHIGDNPIADIQGATNAGVQSFLINSNNKTIADILA